MFRKIETEVERQTENVRTYTKETTWEFYWNPRKKRKSAACGEKIKGWIRNEVTEARNTLIEAAFNNLWHTPLWYAVTYYLAIYWHYIVLIPGVTPVTAGLIIIFVSYLIAALILSYLRRFILWVPGKVKKLFGGNGKA